MKTHIALAVLSICAAATATAQGPASSFPRGNGKQAWQDPGYAAVTAKCAKPPAPFRIGGGAASPADAGPPPEPATPPPSTAIPGVIAAGQTWKVVWHWEGNNFDGPIAAANGKMLVANNDASNVMEVDPATGLAKVVYADVNTGGAVSRSKSGALFLVARGLGSAVWQLEPERKILANTFNGEPLECIGGVLNDLAADSRGGAYVAISGGGVFYASPQGVMTKYDEGVGGANGIVLSPDEKTLYVSAAKSVYAWDVQPDGSLKNQREFAKLMGGDNVGGDGAAVDNDGRLYVATGNSINVFSPKGEYLGLIPGPQGLHGTAFGGADKKTLFGIVFYGTWGTPSARNRLIAIPTLAQGYTGRAK